jgi:hypothetical protein
MTDDAPTKGEADQFGVPTDEWVGYRLRAGALAPWANFSAKRSSTQLGNVVIDWDGAQEESDAESGSPTPYVPSYLVAGLVLVQVPGGPAAVNDAPSSSVAQAAGSSHRSS